jgi:hypothetical protein
MQQGSGLVMFVAPDWFSSGPIDVVQPVEPASHELGVNCRGRNAKFSGDTDRARSSFPIADERSFARPAAGSYSVNDADATADLASRPVRAADTGQPIFWRLATRLETVQLLWPPAGHRR